MWRLTLCILLAPYLAFAVEISREPLNVRQQNPAMMRYFDPSPTSSAIIPMGHQQLHLQTHYTSIFLADQLSKAQRYLADMELFVTEAGVRYGVGHGSDIEITLPIMLPMAGAMDAFLHRYHRVLELPNSGRELRPNDQFGYFYQGSWRSHPRWELGNVRLKLRTQLLSKQWALLAGVQLPTASRSRGWSHGGVDLGLGIVTSWQQGKWFGHGEGWWLHPLTRHDLGSTVRDYLRASATIGRRITLLSIPIHALLQAQGGSSPYRTGVAALDFPPWLISFGLRTTTDQHWQWSAAFVENITQSSTQDFGLSLGLTIPISD